MISANLERRFIAIAIQLNHADSKTISNIARSSYYRSAIVQLCTIVEGLVHELVRRKTKRTKHVIARKEELKKIHIIPKNVLHRKDIVIAKRNERKVKIDDDDVSFKRLNDFLKNKKIINANEYRKLEYVRVERNRLHLQGLSVPDTGYTKYKVKKISEPIEFLIEKL